MRPTSDTPPGPGTAPLVEPGPDLRPDQISRYARHLLVPGLGRVAQRRLLAARVAVVGAGGLGSPVVAYLAAAGVGRLTVIDDDVVDVTNLQRQVMHRADDIGTAKVDSARRFVAGLNPDVRVTTVTERLTPDNAERILAGHDLVLDGADNFPTRYTVSDACTHLGIPVVWAAVLRFDAQISTFVPGGTDAVTLRDLFPLPPAPEDVPSCAEAGVLGALVGQVGSIMAAEAVKLICGVGEPLIGRVLLLDALTQRTREVPLRPRGQVAAAPGHGRSASRPGTETVRAAVPLTELDPREVAERLDTVGRDWVLLDVREPAEHELGTVPGARTVPVGEVLSWETLGGPVPEEPVVLYCRTGPRAARAAAHLIRLGHPDVSVMTGGILGWADAVDPDLPRY